MSSKNDSLKRVWLYCVLLLFGTVLPVQAGESKIGVVDSRRIMQESKAVAQTRELLQNPQRCREAVEKNYQIATCYYSYSVLKQKLRNLVADCLACKGIM